MKTSLQKNLKKLWRARVSKGPYQGEDATGQLQGLAVRNLGKKLGIRGLRFEPQWFLYKGEYVKRTPGIGKMEGWGVVGYGKKKKAKIWLTVYPFETLK